MGIFSTKTTPAPVVTSNGLADQLTAALDRNAVKLDARKGRAISSFRRTVMDLRHVNKALENEVELADQLLADLSMRKDNALTAIADNQKVIDSIIAIIGEVPETCYDEDGDGSCDNCAEEV